VWQDIYDLMSTYHPDAQNASGYSFSESQNVMTGEPLSDVSLTGMLDGTWQINQAGNKVKIPADYFMSGWPESTLIRQ